MKKIISVLLSLAIILSLSVSVSAAPPIELESFSYRIGSGSWQNITSWTLAPGGEYTATFSVPATAAFPVSISVAYDAGWAMVSTVGGELPPSFPQASPMNIQLMDSNSSFTITLTDEDISTQYIVYVGSQAGSTPPPASGSYTTADALAVLRASVGLSTLSAADAAKFGISGTPTTADALKILRISVGLPAEGTPPPPPEERPWWLDENGNVLACFTGDTLIAIEGGFVRFDEINIGTPVWAYNYNMGETALKEVINLLISSSTEIISLETANGEVIKTTAYHPFYVDGKDWVRAGDLSIGDKISTLDGGTITIVGISSERFAEPVVVYNLTVADFHTYFVGSTGILVHNDKGLIILNYKQVNGGGALRSSRCFLLLTKS
jgi:hypothetical protein